jgi:hypothetical protein
LLISCADQTRLAADFGHGEAIFHLREGASSLVFLFYVFYCFLLCLFVVLLPSGTRQRDNELPPGAPSIARPVPAVADAQYISLPCYFVLMNVRRYLARH